MLIKPQVGKGLGRFTAPLLNLEMECSIRPSFLVLWCAFVMWLLIVVMDASITLSLLSDIMCTVYQISACSSSPGSDKSTAQSSSVEGWGTLSNFIVVVKYYFLLFNQVQYVLGRIHPAGVSCQLCMDLKIYILFFLWLFILLTYYYCVSGNPMEAVCTEPCCQLQWVLTSK